MIACFASSYSLLRPMLYAEQEEYGGEKKTVDTIKGEIAITDLHFKYADDMPYVINGLSVNIRAGESVGIIGASGCGKSTLLRLLLGFEKAQSGSIYIDGCDIRELDMKSYRRKIGVVMQNAGLITGDIYSNITLTKPDAAREEVENAIERVGLSELIKSLPMGVHTPISQENCTLSGGEKQRLLIARAIISEPSILIFDEATSALDNVTQAKITESVNKLKCTKIIVAHRLSTIESCDRILVMEKGGIVQEGTFNELQNTDGVWTQLMKKQNIRQ
jgi:ABC-type bacteriocin/lantibiotic exporter with double-glycine peptidase domain